MNSMKKIYKPIARPDMWLKSSSSGLPSNKLMFSTVNMTISRIVVETIIHMKYLRFLIPSQHI